MKAAVNGIHRKRSTANPEISTITDENKVQAAEVKRGNRLSGVYQEISNVKEGVEMKLAVYIAAAKDRGSSVLATKTPAKIMGGMALGAVLMTATALPSAIIYADGPSRPLVGPGSQIIPEDEWIFGPPYHDNFQAETENDSRLLMNRGVEPQIVLEDEWIFGPPYPDNFQAETENDSRLLMNRGVEPQIILEDEWIFGPPYHDNFQAETENDNGHLVNRGVEPPIIPEDEWIFGPPYHDNFQAETENDSRLLVNRGVEPPIIPDDEWIWGSPYHLDFSTEEVASPF